MDEQFQDNLDMTAPESPDGGEKTEPLSITDKFVGIFSEPGAVFDDLKRNGPRASDVIVPLLALVIIAAAGTLIKFSNPEFLADVRDLQVEAMKEQVEKGAMTQEQAGQAMEQIDAFSGFQKVGATVMVFFSIPIMFLLLSLFYWLIVRHLLRGSATFFLVFALYCLTAWIGVLDQLITILVSLVTNNFYATFSPTMFMEPDLKSKVFRLAGNLNPFTVWSLYLFGFGLHRTAGISKPKAFGLVFGLWLLWVIGSSLIKIPGMG